MFLVIKSTDFHQMPQFRTVESYMRSVEKYLERNSKMFEYRNDSYIIYVSNKQDAMIIGMDFKLKKIDFYDGDKFEVVTLISKSQNLSNPTVTDTETGETISLRKFSANQKKEAKKNAITKAKAYKLGLMSKSNLDSAIIDGLIKTINHNGVTYIDQISFFEYAKKNINKKLYQL